MSMNHPIMIAHRGNTNGSHNPLAPSENTIAAFEAAITAGADMLEFDVCRSRDGVLVIHHDPEINQISLADLTIQEIQTIQPEIPTFETTIQHCKNRIPLDIELKTFGNESAVLAIINQHLTGDQFVITSFQAKALQNVRQLQPQVKIGLLIKPAACDRRFPYRVRQPIDRLQPDFLAPHYALINTSWLQTINPSHIPYWIWTVNEPTAIKQFQSNKQVKAIITDRCSQIIPNRTL
ncbi:glycerophosphodiester phosphodiesterase [filamentous cyanobacterium LEGE 11480]|uniref:Glycerophosphodiester phosphodiesterase n=1 Tax=Romeriopsis navalis LEGE 11480 TaxID=2777977 RepID=A0A928VTV8_9CYAN|nr:glycerophosphodiester phosphodiesterase [Romeriopsis navalis]MBE9032452.1 glycerophosphodiester phosphodiesterase [Romeriopsis navalis LEGE 11480]